MTRLLIAGSFFNGTIAGCGRFECGPPLSTSGSFTRVSAPAYRQRGSSRNRFDEPKRQFPRIIRSPTWDESWPQSDLRRPLDYRRSGRIPNRATRGPRTEEGLGRLCPRWDRRTEQGGRGRRRSESARSGDDGASKPRRGSIRRGRHPASQACCKLGTSNITPRGIQRPLTGPSIRREPRNPTIGSTIHVATKISVITPCSSLAVA